MAIKPIKVSQLNSYIKRVLQMDPLLGNVSVIGEISNLKFHGTGHVYFTLKDAASKLSCFLPSDILKEIRYELADGMEITASGYIYLYERGGSYSLNVRDITIQGAGNLSVAFEKLKEKLSREGLFDEKYKKEIPFFPRKVAVITSETGAAVRDILKIIKSRNSIVDVLVYPCLVQGPSAASEIAEAIREVNRLFPETDTIIAGRGGGSMEELWAFNEEVVARSIFDSKIPIISAVGHETDFTIADFVADRRAETPTAAAQMAVPDTGALAEYTADLKNELEHSMIDILNYAKLRISSSGLEALRTAFEQKIQMHFMHIESMRRELYSCMQQRLGDYENLVANCRISLDSLNPYRIMERGYAAVTDQSGNFIRSVNLLSKGNSLRLAFMDGTAECEVNEIWKNGGDESGDKSEGSEQ